MLLAPSAVTRAAAAATREPEQRWMLTQRRSVRASYVHEVLDGDDPDLRQQIWMLGQPDEVRESFIREVLEASGEPELEEVWMLRQSERVRRSYVQEVLRPGLSSHDRPGDRG